MGNSTEAIVAILQQGTTLNSSTSNSAVPDIFDAYSTNEYAGFLGEKSASIRSEYCRNGAVKGIVPIKMPGRAGRLRWPKKEVLALFVRQQQKGGK